MALIVAHHLQLCKFNQTNPNVMCEMPLIWEINQTTVPVLVLIK